MANSGRRRRRKKRRVFDGLDDPGLSPHLAASPDEIRARGRRRYDEIVGAMDKGDQGVPIRIPDDAIARPVVTEVELPLVLVEVEEINGHVVLWLQPNVVVAPSVFSTPASPA